MCLFLFGEMQCPGLSVRDKRESRSRHLDKDKAFPPRESKLPSWVTRFFPWGGRGINAVGWTESQDNTHKNTNQLRLTHTSTPIMEAYTSGNSQITLHYDLSIPYLRSGFDPRSTLVGIDHFCRSILRTWTSFVSLKKTHTRNMQQFLKCCVYPWFCLCFRLAPRHFTCRDSDVLFTAPCTQAHLLA